MESKILLENYNGPRELIKKSSNFKALRELYCNSKVLFVKVRQVLQKLN
ncbi:MAG: hypothetical protein QW372_03825 [Nitrososphaerales archaeon]